MKRAKRMTAGSTSRKQDLADCIAESVYHLDDGETFASVEGKRAALASRIRSALARERNRAAWLVADRAPAMKSAKNWATWRKWVFDKYGPRKGAKG